MATRKRTIQPNIWQDTEFGLLSLIAKLLWLGCITQADDEGRLTGNPMVLRGILFPFGEVSLEEIFDGIEELRQKMKNFVYYEVGGEFYIQLKNWEKHQVLRSDRSQKSTFPPPPRELLVDTRLTSGCQAGTQVSKEVSKQVSNNAVELLKNLRKDLEEKGILSKNKLL